MTLAMLLLDVALLAGLAVTFYGAGLCVFATDRSVFIFAATATLLTFTTIEAYL